MTDKPNCRVFSTGVLLLFVLAVSLAWGPRAGAQVSQEDHKPAVHGVAIRMTAQDVLDHLGGRMPDSRKDEKSSVLLTWKLEDGNVLQVTFRGENVSELRLWYKKLRPTTDLWLAPLSSPASSTELTAADPRLRRDYKATQTDDKLRTVWIRREKASPGYDVEISFLSSSRTQSGDRFEEYVEYKYVIVPKEELKKFDKAYLAVPAK